MNKNKRGYQNSDRANYNNQDLNSITKTEIEIGGKDLRRLDNSLHKPSTENISIDNMKLRSRKKAKTRRKYHKKENLMVNDNLNLDASLKANSKNSQYLINSLKNSQELSSKLRNINKKDTKPQICIGGFDMSKLASSNKINRNILKGALTESLPSINEAKQNLLLPYAVSSKPGSRYQKVSVFIKILQINNQFSKLGQLNLNSNNIHNQANTRNNITLLEGNEGVLRAKSYNK